MGQKEKAAKSLSYFKTSFPTCRWLHKRRTLSYDQRWLHTIINDRCLKFSAAFSKALNSTPKNGEESMKNTLTVCLVGLLMVPAASFADDHVMLKTPTTAIKSNPALAPTTNKKLLDVAKNLKPEDTSTTTSEQTNTTPSEPATYTVVMENLSLVQDPNTCYYTWNVRLHNTGTAPVPEGELSLVTRAIKQDYSYTGAPTTIPLRTIQPGAYYPVGASIPAPTEAVSMLFTIEKGTESVSSTTNYPFTPNPACSQQK
jgi:hypothetical protein